MGQFCGKPDPIPPHSTLNEQKMEWGTCYCGYFGQVVPSWMAGSLNSDLLALDFTQQNLDEEITHINEHSERVMHNKNNSCRYCWWAGTVSAIAMVVCGLVIILVIDPAWVFVIFAVIGGAVLGFYAFYYGVLWHYIKQWNECLSDMELYVTADMNEKYTRQAIHWSVRKRKERHGCGRGSYWIQYMDICCTPSSKYIPVQPQSDRAQDDKAALIMRS